MKPQHFLSERPGYTDCCSWSQIRVNTVNPTVVMTDMGRINWSDPQKAAAMINRIPLGKFAGQWGDLWPDWARCVEAFPLTDVAAAVPRCFCGQRHNC